MAKVGKDDKGLYVIAGGWVFRPKCDTKFKVGDNIPARHIGGSSFGTVGKGADRERWQIIDSELSPEMEKCIAARNNTQPTPNSDMRKELAQMQIDGYEEGIKILRKLDLNTYFPHAPTGLIEDVIKEAESDVSAMKVNINKISECVIMENLYMANTPSTSALPCPFCGKQVDLSDLDTLYPSGIVYKDCQDIGRHYGTRKEIPQYDGQCYVLRCDTGVGCGASMSGDSVEEVLEQWNRRV